MFIIERSFREFKNPIVLLVLITILNYFLFPKNQNPSLLEGLLNKELLFVGEIYSRPKMNDFNSTYFLELDYVIDGKTKINLTDKVFVKGSKYIVFHRGDVVQIKGKIARPKGAVLPELFSEKNYLASKGVNYVLEEKKGSVFLSKSKCSDFYTYVDFLRDDFLIKEQTSKISFLNPNTDVLSLINAIIFGNEASKLPKDLNQKVRDLGLSHVVSASGFNVSILAAAIFFLFSFFSIFKRHKLIPTFVSLLAIFLYVAIADFSPSVLRAGVFSILVLIANFLDLKIKPLPALSFILLLFYLNNPSTLFDIGFQLSFFAFSGLILFYKDIYEFISEFTSNYLKPVLAILISSLIAQLFVFPLICFYFHNIQIMGIISNLIATPIAALILIFGLGFIATTKIFFLEPLSDFIYLMLVICGKIFVLWIDLLSKLPIKSIYLSVYKLHFVFVSYLIMFLFLISVLKKKTSLIVLSLLAFFLLIFYTSYIETTQNIQSVYFIKKYNKDFVLSQNQKENILFYTGKYKAKDINFIRGYLEKTHNKNPLQIKELNKNTIISHENTSVELIANYKKPVVSKANYIKLPILMKVDPDFRSVVKSKNTIFIINDYKYMSKKSKKSLAWLKSKYNCIQLSESGTLEIKWIKPIFKKNLVVKTFQG